MSASNQRIEAFVDPICYILIYSISWEFRWARPINELKHLLIQFVIFGEFHDNVTNK